MPDFERSHTMNNYVDNPEMPLGLGIALAQNITAMNYFASLPKSKQQEVIDGTHKIQSKQEMRQYVQDLITLS